MELLRTLYILTVIQLILFAIFLLNYEKQKNIGNKILSAFLISNALYIVYYILFGGNGYLREYSVDFFHAGFPFCFLFGPLLYFYTKCLTYVNFKLKKKYLIHLIPFILKYLFLFLTLYIHSHEVKLEILRSEESLFNIVDDTIFWLFQLHILSYLFASLKIIKKHRRRLLQHYSNIDHTKLNWLRIILWGFIFIWQIELASFVIYKIFAIVNHFVAFSVISAGINYVGAIFLVYSGLKNPGIFSCLEKRAKKLKYEKSALSPDLKNGYLKKLMKYMEKEKPYLIFSITLSDISKNLSIPQNYLSQVINELLNQNFYDFINCYRIKEAKKILTDTEYKKRTVLEILYDVGFNSKSTFYTAFTKEVGITPVAFRKRHSEN